jgi:hypothetical protein
MCVRRMSWGVGGLMGRWVDLGGVEVDGWV